MEGSPIALSDTLSEPIQTAAVTKTVPAQAPAKPIGHPIDRGKSLLRSALDGAGLSDLVQVLSGQLDRPVVVETRFGQVLASASSRANCPFEPVALSARARRSVPREGIARVSVASGDLTDASSRLATAIVADGGVVGYLSVLDVSTPLGEVHQSLIGQAALAGAVEFVRQRAAVDAELRLKGSLLDVLLFDEGSSSTTTALRSAVVGYDVGRPQTLLLLSVDPPLDGDGATYNTHDLGETLVPWLRQEHPMSLLAEKDGGIVLLVSHSGSWVRRRQRRAESVAPSSTGQLDPLAGQLIEELRSEVARIDERASLSIVAASPVEWRDVRRVYAIAQRARIAQELLGGHGQTVSTADPRLAIFLLLDGTEEASLREFVRIVLGPLMSYDDHHGHILVDTLAAYLAGEGHIETIARSLNIHASTLKYRLRRIGEVGGLDLRNPDHRFNAALALRLRGILRPY